METLSFVVVIILIFLAISFKSLILQTLKVLYHGSKFPGPFAYPITGNIHMLQGGYEVIYHTICTMCQNQPEIFRFWLGPDLIIFVSKLDEIDIILNKCLNKGKHYQLAERVVGNGLIIIDGDVWKVRRKIISPTFNTITLNSFIESFYKHAKKLVENVESRCDQGCFDVMHEIFKSTLDMSIENLMDLDPSQIKTSLKSQFINDVMKMEELIILQLVNPLNNISFLKKMTRLDKEIERLFIVTRNFLQQMLDTKENQIKNSNNDEAARNRRFLNHLFYVRNDSEKLDNKGLTDEAIDMLVASSETTAIASSTILLILAMMPHIQDKVYKELESIFHGSDRDLTLDDLTKMNYLELVIKESLRIIPTVPIIARKIDQDVDLGTHLIPAGAFVFVPIVHIHKKPEFFENPSEFIPERFSKDFDHKIHKKAWMPFGHGLRNCIGTKYAMMSLKIVLSTFLRNYIVHSPHFKSFEELKFQFIIVAKVVGGYEICISKRKKIVD